MCDCLATLAPQFLPAMDSIGFAEIRLSAMPLGLLVATLALPRER